MKYKIVFLFMILFSATSPCQSDRENTYGIKFTKLGEGVIIITGARHNTNQLAINSSKGIILIDTGISPEYARAVRDSLKIKFKHDHFAYVINTHSHWDHVQGNQIFPEAVIVGHTNCVYEMESQRPAINVERSKIKIEIPSGKGGALPPPPPSSVLVDGINGYKLTTPLMTFNDEMKIFSGDVTLWLIYFGRGHSNSDVIIYIPEEKILVVGDLFNKKSLPPFGSGKKLDVRRWIDVLEKILDDKNEIKLVVPGHNETFGKEDMILYKNYIVKLWNGIKEEKLKGKSLIEIKNEFSLKNKFPKLAGRDMKSQNGKSLHDGNVDKLWNQINKKGTPLSEHPF